MNRKSAARRAGRSCSEAKRRAAIANGRLGGRPRKSALADMKFSRVGNDLSRYTKAMVEMFAAKDKAREHALEMAAVVPDSGGLAMLFAEYNGLGDTVSAVEFAARAKLSPDREAWLTGAFR